MDEPLEIWHLGVGAASMGVLVILFWVEKIGLWRASLIASLRMVVQLTLLGIILDFLFSSKVAWWTLGFLMVMVGVATRESVQRLKFRMSGLAHLFVPLFSLLTAALPYTLLLIAIIFKPDPWYDPSIVLPIFGMILGNVMNTISLALNQFLNSLDEMGEMIEQRLALGHTTAEVLGAIRSESVRTAMLPVINAMAVTGIVSLPGMMTGQILAGESPGQAVRYQILIWFGIASGAGISALMTLTLATRVMVNDRGHLIKLVKNHRK